MQFKESALAHELLDGLKGIEIGGGAHNAFGLDTLNVDKFGEMDTVFKLAEIENCGRAMPVDVVASGDNLPFEDSSFDFVISSHVLEHFYDPIKALMEWNRVVRDGGYIYAIVPHKERTFDRLRPRTTLNELVKRHENPNPPSDDEVSSNHEHWSVWVTDDVFMLALHCGLDVIRLQDVDDKVGNGFTVVVQVHKPEADQ